MLVTAVLATRVAAGDAEQATPGLWQTVSAPLQRAIEPCREEVTAPELAPIRSKADVGRTADEGPPPFRVELNDSFASDPERPVIARWIGIQRRCRGSTALPGATLTSLDPFEMAALRETVLLTRLWRADAAQLTHALYLQLLTYGEFARKKYELTRDTASIFAMLDRAARDADPASLAEAARRLVASSLTWRRYLWGLQVRPARVVHVAGVVRS